MEEPLKPTNLSIASYLAIFIKTHGSEARPSKVGRATTVSYLHERTILIECS